MIFAYHQICCEIYVCNSPLHEIQVLHGELWVNPNYQIQLSKHVLSKPLTADIWLQVYSCHWSVLTTASIHQADRRLTSKSRLASKQRDWMLHWSIVLKSDRCMSSTATKFHEICWWGLSLLGAVKQQAIPEPMFIQIYVAIWRHKVPMR